MSKRQPDPQSAPKGRASPPRAGSALTKELSRVEEAGYSLYEAFSGKNIEAMAKVWSRSPYARCIHPGWDPVVGWQDIRQSWVDIFESIDEISFELTDIHVEVAGRIAWINLLAYANVTTEDEGEFNTVVVATTIFEESDGQWLIVLHHSSHYAEDEEDEEDNLALALGRGESGTFEPN
jgi:ketosteroid isomerase-like protein